jgi:capsule polysaccharide export protein KpsE/RkpR
VAAATIEQTAPQAESVTEAASRNTEALAQRDAEIRTLKDLVVKKELELDTLRNELESVRKQLDSQKRKITPPSKPTPTTP